jgi:pilus assembly protein CpaC
MSRKLLLGAVAAACVCLAAAGTSAEDARDDAGARVIAMSVHGGSPSSRHLTLSVNKATIVQLDTEARDVLVSNPEIVDAVVRTPRRIFLLGMKTGQTNAFFFDGAGHRILSLDINVEKETGDIASLIHAALPGSSIHVSAVNDSVVLSGTVSSAQESTRAQDVAVRFTGDATKVVNMLKIAGGEQVMLKVRVAEMDRNVAKQFGVNIEEAAIAAGVPIIASTGNQFGLLGKALSDASGAQFGSVCAQHFLPTQSTTTTTTSINNVSNNPNLMLPGIANGVTSVVTNGVPCASPNNVQGVLQALDQIGLVHILAEPNLTAISGETARFLAGGQFPVPSGRDNQGNVSIEFKDFGVGLSFTPVVLSPGRISLQISTEVSELTNTGAFTLAGSTQLVNGALVTVPGLTIPALAVRRAQTTVELPSGGSFAIAGLMQHTTKQVLEQFPGIGEMPVLGSLFRSRDFQNNETELVVLVSAYLVNPTVEAKLSMPMDGYQIPTDPETILLGHLNAVYKHDPGTSNKIASGSAGGYIVQ